jgi:hypothetical protein
MQTPKQEAVFVTLATMLAEDRAPVQFSYADISTRLRQSVLVDAWKLSTQVLPPSYEIQGGVVRVLVALKTQGLVRSNGPIRHVHPWDTTIVSGWTLSSLGRSLAQELQIVPTEQTDTVGASA